jgi:hypothetical protein
MPSLKQSSATKSASKSPKNSGQFRIGKVQGYLRGSVWYLYYHDQGQRRRPRVGPGLEVARQMAAQINSQLETGAPAALSFETISIVDLRNRWLAHHEHVLRSSIASIKRYRAATEHLIRYVQGVILETCRTLFAYAMKRRHFSPYAENPFSALELGRLPIEHVKPIILLTEEQQVAFLKACDGWQFQIDNLPSWASTRLAESELSRRILKLESESGDHVMRAKRAQLSRGLWNEMGIVETDRIRIEYMRLTKVIGQPELTAPKTLRHLFATALQDANVDPLIRNELMGHAAASAIGGNSLGMTANYTHTRIETKRRQLEQTFERSSVVRYVHSRRV